MSTSSTPRTDSTKVLTRREARAIERQTGVRPAAAPAAVTGVSAPVIDASIAELSATKASRLDAPAASVHDTARIERNQRGSLVSVLPVAPAADRAAVQGSEQADDAPSADVTHISEAFTGRAVSIRAAKPAALVARGRRRTAASFAAAATVAAAATAGIVVPAAVADGKSEVQSQANLVAATAPDATAAPADATTTTPAAEAAPAEEAALVAAPEVAVDRTDSTVVSISSDDLAAVAETPTPTPTPEETQEPVAESSTSSSTSSGGGTSSQTSTTSSSSSSGSSAGGSGNVDTSSLIAAAHSYVGSYFPACTDLTKAVYATQGISLSGSVSNQIAGARQTSSPQPGDLVVQPGAHIGIYAGDGMVIDSPGYGGKVVQYRSIWWSNPVYYTFN
ncbi:NlpC/P60 family protein [Pseudoclavibacter terrae]|uniref:NlpC/P60 family protein n=1 Tax=Pseudoclavibacter terrae TaxID=1530195 RepID=A0A7J5B745_9MICO|nr:NlpC/P60 family protein [Pseudoclavibacter terrae]KAB1639481.1 NlpC/P60 family protein [Pseudoclavibacter terrae]